MTESKPGPEPAPAPERQWGLAFPIPLALASRIVGMPTERIGDFFYPGWRMRTRADPVWVDRAGLLLIATAIEVLHAAGVDLGDPRSTLQPEPHMLVRLRASIADAWRHKEGLMTYRGISLVNGVVPAGGWGSRHHAPVIIDLGRVAVGLQSRIARVTTTSSMALLDDELVDWMHDALRSAQQARLVVQAAAADADGAIDGPNGPLAVRAELEDALNHAVRVLHETLERVVDLQAVLRDPA